MFENCINCSKNVGISFAHTDASGNTICYECWKIQRDEYFKQLDEMSKMREENAYNIIKQDHDKLCKVVAHLCKLLKLDIEVI